MAVYLLVFQTRVIPYVIAKSVGYPWANGVYGTGLTNRRGMIYPQVRGIVQNSTIR